MKNPGKRIREWLFVWIIVIFLGICAVGAAAESLYTGTWYLAAFSDDAGEHRIPSKMLQIIPEIDFRSDQTARVVLEDGAELEGKWVPAEEGEGLWLYTDFLDDIRFFYTEGRLAAKENNQETGRESFIFAREEKQSPCGTWEMTVSMGLGASVQTHTDSKLDRIDLNADGSARMYSVDEQGSVLREDKGTWTRKGNDIIFSLLATDESGKEICVPYQYFRLDTGLLIRYDRYDNQTPVIQIRTNQTLKPRDREIVSLKPFLGTKWVQAGEKLLDFIIPGLAWGKPGIETIFFDDRGGFRIDVASYGSVPGRVALENDRLKFTYGKSSSASAYMTDTGFLGLDLGDGMVICFLPACDTPDQETVSALDLRIAEKKGRDTARRGEKLSFSAEFADSSVVNKKAKNNKVEWKVTDETGLEIPGLSVDKKGNLSVGKKCPEDITAVVTARSVSYGTVAEYPVRIVAKNGDKGSKNSDKPVTGLKLSVKGKAKPGKSVTVNAAVTPKNATDKTLEWSLENVDESIATISEKGVVSISADAPAGTVIKVVCRAAHASEPVTAEIEITVKK